MALGVKKGDTVLVIGGKDKGKVGKIDKVLPPSKVIIAGINVIKKHTRASKKNPQGGIIEISAPLQISNVMLICSKCHKPTRVGWRLPKTEGEGKMEKERICRRCGGEI